MGSTGCITCCMPRSWWPNRALEWPAEGSVEVPARRQYSARMRYCLPGCRVPSKNNTWVQETRDENSNITQLTIFPNDLLWNVVLTIPTTLSSVELVVLIPKRGIFLLGTQCPTELSSAGAWEHEISRVQGLVGKKGINALSEVAKSKQQEEIGLLLHNGSK